MITGCFARTEITDRGLGIERRRAALRQAWRPGEDETRRMKGEAFGSLREAFTRGEMAGVVITCIIIVMLSCTVNALYNLSRL
jgi:hypothetical protein